MNKVFICTPYRGDIKKNVRNAKIICGNVARNGNAVFAPHLLYTQFLNDELEQERDLGINSGIEFMNDCDWLFYWPTSVKEISEGMFKEIMKAASLGIEVLPLPMSLWPDTKGKENDEG